MTLLMRSGDGSWSEPEMTGHENEASLQEIIAKHPALIPGVSSEAIACREFSSGVGPADVVILDATGDVTLVECKLATNPQIRREIVGQVLDYASRLWGMSVDDFEEMWRRASGAVTSPLTVFDERGLETRDRLEEGLASGRMTIVLAVDRVNDSLKRIVEYLNSITIPEVAVFVMEFTRAQHGDTQVLMPVAFGVDLAQKKERRGREARDRWPVEAFLEWGRDNDAAGVPTYVAFANRLTERGWRVNGGRASTPSLNASVEVAALGGKRKWPICMYTDERRGMRFEVRFSDFVRTPEVAAALAEAVERALPGLINPQDLEAQGYRSQPRVDFSSLTQDQVIALVDAIDEALQELGRAQ